MRHGDPTFNNKAKSRDTCMSRYGVSCPQRVQSVMDKMMSTREANCIEKYGSKTYLGS